MRFTKSICALLLPLAVTVSGQALAQTAAPVPPGGNANDDQLREAVRKALEADGGQPAAPARPVTPVTPTPAAPVRPVVPTTKPVSQPDPKNVAAPIYDIAPPSGTNLTTVSLSLEEAIRLALEHNLNLQVEKYTPIISEYDRRSLYGAYDPTFSSSLSRANNHREPGGINLNTGRSSPGTRSETDNLNAGLSGLTPWGMTYGLTHDINDNNVITPNQIGTNSFGQPTYGKPFRSDTWNSTAALKVAQPLLKGFWIDDARLRLKLARRDVNIADLNYEREVMRVLNAVEQAYYELIARRELVRVQESDTAVKRQFYEENQQRVKAGVLAPLDEKLAQAELSKSEILAIYARNNAETAEHNLKALIHDNFIKQLNVRLALTDRMLAVPATIEMYDAFKQAVEKRPDLQVMRLNLEKNQIQLKYDKNQVYPQLDVFATLGYAGLDTSVGGAFDDIAQRRFEQSSFGVSISFPFIQKAAREHKRATEAAIEQAVYAVKQLEQVIVTEIEVQTRLLRTYWLALPLTREQISYEQAALEAEQKKLQAGKSTSFNVLKIASDLTSAQANEISTLRDYNQALSEFAFRKGTSLERWRIDPPARAGR